MIKVLIVDDDKLARQGLISLMNWEKYGMQVAGDVQNGKKALEFVNREPVDLVFVDIDMPEMNGLEFMKQCHQANADIQFVVLSFYERFDYVQATLRLGGLDYISKVSMDLENCEEVLDRIRRKYDERKGLSERLPERDGDEAEELRSRWKSLYWVFDDESWDKLKGQTKGKRTDVRRLEILVSGCIGELEKLAGLKEGRLPLFGNVDELMEWVSRYRVWLYEDTKRFSRESEVGRMINTVSFMKEHFARDISVAEAASRIAVSRSSFCVMFRKWTGTSFGEYLQKLRLGHAREMLEKTDCPVAEIAFRCGYNDIYYFSRVFHKAVGYPPADYRNMKKVQAGPDDFEKTERN